MLLFFEGAATTATDIIARMKSLKLKW